MSDELPDILTGTERFMEAAGQLGVADDGAMWIDDANRKLRRDMLLEEWIEYMNAEASHNLVEVVDGLLDVIVVAWGTILSYVGPERADRAADEVTRSNLAKVVNGKVIRRDDGKILKPKGWVPPDIARALFAPPPGDAQELMDRLRK